MDLNLFPGYFNSVRDLSFQSVSEIAFSSLKTSPSYTMVIDEYRHIIPELSPCPGMDSVIQNLKKKESHWG